MMSFSILDIFLFIGISQGVFLSISLQFIKNKNRTANKTLSIIVLLATLMLSGVVFRKYFPENLSWRMNSILDNIIFLFGPFLYIYVRQLVFEKQKLSRFKKTHYLPSLIHFIYFVWTLFYSTDEFEEMYRSGIVKILFFIIELAGLLSFIFYTIKLFDLQKRYKKIRKNQISYNQDIEKFLHFIVITLMIFIILWSFSFLNWQLENKANPLINYYSIWITISLFVYIIGYYNFREPEIFRVSITSIDKKKITKPRLNSEEIQSLKTKLDHIICTEQIFLQSNINLNKLAKKIDTTPNNISWFLNKIHQQTFYEFINTLRIEAFIEKVQQGEHHKNTLIALAIDVGFNSKSTFYNAFKLVMKDSPSNYIKKLEDKTEINN